MTRRLLALAIATTAVLGTGCEAIDDLDLEPYMPTVTFKEMSVLGVDWDGVDADFVFQVDNPNPIDINMARFDYALAFEEVEWLSGDSPDGLALAADDGSELALPVAIEFESLFNMVQAIRGEDEIGFGLAGSFGFDTPIGPVDLPYAEEGGFPAARKPDVTLNSVKVRDISISGADLRVKLDVDNDHGSNIFLQNMDYSLSLAGVSVGGGLISDFGEVTGAETKTLNIPVEVDFLDLGTAIYSALLGDEIEVGLDAVVDVDTPFGIIPMDIARTKSLSIER